MKANELSCKDLMIGDWVMINPISYYQVEQIRVEFGELRIYLKGTEVFATENEIIPVPLTPEILKKNGFTYIIVLGEVAPKLENFELDNHWEGDGYSWNDIPLLYVHQLQHALRLCGIDKNIEL